MSRENSRSIKSTFSLTHLHDCLYRGMNKFTIVNNSLCYMIHICPTRLYYKRKAGMFSMNRGECLAIAGFWIPVLVNNHKTNRQEE